MDTAQELEILIEQLKAKLRNYLDDERSKDDIYELSAQIDTLIIEYYNLTKNKKVT